MRGLLIVRTLEGPHALSCFFFNDTATPEIYTLSLHDALPIYSNRRGLPHVRIRGDLAAIRRGWRLFMVAEHILTGVEIRRRSRLDLSGKFRFSRSTTGRSEEHTSELQSRFDLVCRLLLEKKKK